jgi:hypothetical protein
VIACRLPLGRRRRWLGLLGERRGRAVHLHSTWSPSPSSVSWNSVMHPEREKKTRAIEGGR